MENEAVSVRQAAALLGITPDAVRKRIKRGLLQTTKDNQGRILVYLLDIPIQDNAENSKTQETIKTIREDVQAVQCPNCIKLLQEYAALSAKYEILSTQIAGLKADRDEWRTYAKDMLQIWHRDPSLSLPGAVTETDKQPAKEAPRGLWARLRDAIKPHKE